MFEVITGGYEKKQQQKKVSQEIKHKKLMELWRSLYFSYKYGYEGTVDTDKAIYFGVKYYARFDIDKCDYRELLIALSEYNDIKMMMAFKTPKELSSIFPIIKEYDGHRYECKDYFSTIEYLDTLNQDIELGIKNVDEFFWNYYNNDIMNFSVKELLIFDRIRRLNGQKSLMESFIEDMGLEDEIHTYTFDKETNTMYDNVTGECFDVVITKTEKRNLKEEIHYKVIEFKEE